MLQKVSVSRKKLSRYRGIVSDEIMEQLNQLSRDLSGLKVLHVNATRFGGGVAEILESQVPLEQDLGIKSEWQTIVADDRLFAITKAFHNAFQGENYEISRDIERTYKRFNAYNAHLMGEGYDVVLIHDPQPAAIPYYLPDDHMKFIWRCHIDTSHPNREMWKFFKPFLEEYDQAVFTMPEFVPKDLPIEDVIFIPPAIDPLAPKNDPLSERAAKKIIKSFGISVKKPLATQVSRYDVWKDPVGVIEAYKIAKKKVKDLQLALVGSMATDDPEGWIIYKKIEKMAAHDPDIHLLTNLGNIEVSAFQSYSDAVLQKSLREGFGLTVTEAMWKGSPVIGGNVGGIKSQIKSGKDGFLVNSVEECAERLIYLLDNQHLKQEMGLAAKEAARENLMPRLVRDHLNSYKIVLKKEKVPA